jgi:hypothetical protein
MGSLAGAHRSSFFVRASPDTGTVLRASGPMPTTTAGSADKLPQVLILNGSEGSKIP